MGEIERIKDEVETMESYIVERKEARAQSQGAIKTYMKQLKDSYDINSKEEMNSFIEDGKAELENISKRIKKLYEEISNEYERATS